MIDDIGGWREPGTGKLEEKNRIATKKQVRKECRSKESRPSRPSAKIEKNGKSLKLLKIQTENLRHDFSRFGSGSGTQELLYVAELFYI